MARAPRTRGAAAIAALPAVAAPAAGVPAGDAVVVPPTDTSPPAGDEQHGTALAADGG